MSKHEKKNVPETHGIDAGGERAEPGGIPLWAVAAGLLMLAAGAVVYATKDSRERSHAIKALNEARIKVSGTENGLGDGFATVVVESNRREYLDLLGACTSDPEMALGIYREVLDDDLSSDAARVLALRMAFYLLKDGRLKDGAEKEVLEKLVANLAPGKSKNARWVAQWVLGYLVVISDAGKKGEYEKMPEKPKEVLETEKKDEASGSDKGAGESKKDAWKVELAEHTLKPYDHPGGPDALKEERKYLTPSWSSPDACYAWWQAYGKNAAWDKDRQVFVLAAP